MLSESNNETKVAMEAKKPNLGLSTKQNQEHVRVVSNIELTKPYITNQVAYQFILIDSKQQFNPSLINL